MTGVESHLGGLTPVAFTAGDWIELERYIHDAYHQLVSSINSGIFKALLVFSMEFDSTIELVEGLATVLPNAINLVHLELSVYEEAYRLPSSLPLDSLIGVRAPSVRIIDLFMHDAAYIALWALLLPYFPGLVALSINHTNELAGYTQMPDGRAAFDEAFRSGIQPLDLAQLQHISLDASDEPALEHQIVLSAIGSMRFIDLITSNHAVLRALGTRVTSVRRMNIRNGRDEEATNGLGWTLHSHFIPSETNYGGPFDQKFLTLRAVRQATSLQYLRIQNVTDLDGVRELLEAVGCQLRGLSICYVQQEWVGDAVVDWVVKAVASRRPPLARLRLYGLPDKHDWRTTPPAPEARAIFATWRVRVLHNDDWWRTVFESGKWN
ncbi:hypothetical protein BKA62DRAFT_702652 [Auriculariales sp. MPI-PUGE-AT-0066]|nr:hypothetical protein BKA62DRAFT_702652 [Auriculariales sp. MPI-PUGE-AT-0066]